MTPEAIDRHWRDTVGTLSEEYRIPRWRIEEAFAYGACAELALAVAEHRGLQIGVIGHADSYSHAFCVVADGYGLDIWGVRTFAEIERVWHEDDPDCSIRIVSANELRSMGGSLVAPEFADIPARLARDGCLAGAVLDDFTLSEFNCGACGDLAAYLHELTGWEIWAELADNGDIEHAWVVNDDGNAVDINGVHEGMRAVTPYSSRIAGRLVPLAKEDCAGKGRFGEEYRAWAAALVERYPERFGAFGFSHGDGPSSPRSCGP